MSSLEQENTTLKTEIKKLQLENEELKKKLKKYTNSNSNKKYYENHKSEIIKKSNERLKNLPKEKLREYRRRAYLKMKEKRKTK
jgi:hypothetical protein